MTLVSHLICLCWCGVSFELIHSPSERFACGLLVLPLATVCMYNCTGRSKGRWGSLCLWSWQSCWYRGGRGYRWWERAGRSSSLDSIFCPTTGPEPKQPTWTQQSSTLQNVTWLSAQQDFYQSHWRVECLSSAPREVQRQRQSSILQNVTWLSVQQDFYQSHWEDFFQRQRKDVW